MRAIGSWEEHDRAVREMVEGYGAEWLVPAFEWANLWEASRPLREGSGDRGWRCRARGKSLRQDHLC